MSYQGDPVRLLIVPGLHGSGPTHWQTWLQHRWRHSARVEQHDWATPNLDVWADRIADTLAGHRGVRWVAAAHSFGCLALARYLARQPRGEGPVRAALFAAPAAPEKFGVSDLLPQRPLALPSYLIGSETDPWMSAAEARLWAHLWRSHFINLGDVGHLNVEAGFGPWPQAHTLVQLLVQQVQRSRRWERAHPLELSFAV